MAYLIDLKEELDEKIYEQLRKFTRKCRGTDSMSWFRVQMFLDRARDTNIYHEDVEAIAKLAFFDDDGYIMNKYYTRDPQRSQVTMVSNNLRIASSKKRKRGRVNSVRLKNIMLDILKMRVELYLNPPDEMEKLKILCILGTSGSGKTLASLHLKYHKEANVICSFTTRPPRDTEVEGRDHHFIDIVPDKTDIIAHTYFGGYYYYATKWQVSGPCTVYVIDRKGLESLRKDWSEVFDIYTVLIKRSRELKRKSGVSETRIRRDERDVFNDEDYDYVIENNGRKAKLFNSIERIYEEIKNK